MNCREFRKRHTAFAEGELPAQATTGMYDHLEECARCATFDATIRRGLLVARNLPSIEPSRDFGMRLQARLRAAQAAAGPRSWDHGGWGHDGKIVRRTLLDGIRVAAAVGVILAGLVAMHRHEAPYAHHAEQAATQGVTDSSPAALRTASLSP